MERIDYRPQHDFDKVFPIWHVILYYLGWYTKSEDRWADLKNCLIMDGYCGEHMSNADVYQFILNIADDFNLHCANKGWKLISISKTIVPDFYAEKYKKAGLPNPEWLSGIDALIAEFAFGYSRSEVKLAKPDFKRGDPIRYSGYRSGKTYREANKHTESYKWEGEQPSWDWRKYFHRAVKGTKASKGMYEEE